MKKLIFLLMVLCLSPILAQAKDPLDEFDLVNTVCKGHVKSSIKKWYTNYQSSYEAKEQITYFPTQKMAKVSLAERKNGSFVLERREDFPRIDKKKDQSTVTARFDSSCHLIDLDVFNGKKTFKIPNQVCKRFHSNFHGEIGMMKLKSDLDYFRNRVVDIASTIYEGETNKRWEGDYNSLALASETCAGSLGWMYSDYVNVEKGKNQSKATNSGAPSGKKRYIDEPETEGRPAASAL